MNIWPNELAIRACISWNYAAMQQAERDSKNEYVVVPATATKRIYGEGRALNIRLSSIEYREARRRDALRHKANCDALYARLQKEAA